MDPLAEGHAERAAVAIAISICTTKQHYVVDGVAALILAAVVWWFTLRGAPPEPGVRADFGMKGAAMYLAFHTLFYAESE